MFSLFRRKKTDDAAAPAATLPAADAAAHEVPTPETAPAQAVAPVPAATPPAKPGFFARLWGGAETHASSTAPAPEQAAPATEPPSAPAPAPAPASASASELASAPVAQAATAQIAEPAAAPVAQAPAEPAPASASVSAPASVPVFAPAVEPVAAPVADAGAPFAAAPAAQSAPQAPVEPPATAPVVPAAAFVAQAEPAPAPASAAPAAVPASQTPAEPVAPPAAPVAQAPALAPASVQPPAQAPIQASIQASEPVAPELPAAIQSAAAEKDLELAPPSATAQAARSGWLERLKTGLKKTGASITTVFSGAQIDDTLYEDLETALLMADAGVPATEYLLAELKRRVKETRASDPAQVKALLQDAIADMLAPLEKPLVVGLYHPTVIMVAGVNGAGKTTSIGKLTKHLADAGASVLLAAADTFRAAAREQLSVWADRTRVEIISQQGADPSAVSFDAVGAGRARGMDVVLIDTAGRLPTQKHLMEELSKIRRVVTKADLTAPHEVLLVIDGNTGQNALAQVKAFDAATPLTGLIVTKLDGTAKGGVLCAIAREKPIPVYFIGVGERLQDLQTFNAREFAQAIVH